MKLLGLTEPQNAFFLALVTAKSILMNTNVQVKLLEKADRSFCIFPAECQVTWAFTTVPWRVSTLLQIGALSSATC